MSFLWPSDYSYSSVCVSSNGRTNFWFPFLPREPSFCSEVIIIVYFLVINLTLVHSYFAEMSWFPVFFLPYSGYYSLIPNFPNHCHSYFILLLHFLYFSNIWNSLSFPVRPLVMRQIAVWTMAAITVLIDKSLIYFLSTQVIVTISIVLKSHCNLFSLWYRLVCMLILLILYRFLLFLTVFISLT